MLRDHLERLLCPLLNAMPRRDVEALLAGGNTALIQFGRPAVAAAVVTAMLQTPREWTSVRRAIHAACRGGQSLNGSGAEQDNAAELAEQLLARLDFGLSLYQRRREALNAEIRRCRGDAPTAEADKAILRS